MTICLFLDPGRKSTLLFLRSKLPPSNTKLMLPHFLFGFPDFFLTKLQLKKLTVSTLFNVILLYPIMLGITRFFSLARSGHFCNYIMSRNLVMLSNCNFLSQLISILGTKVMQLNVIKVLKVFLNANHLYE